MLFEERVGDLDVAEVEKMHMSVNNLKDRKKEATWETMGECLSNELRMFQEENTMLRGKTSKAKIKRATVEDRRS